MTAVAFAPRTIRVLVVDNYPVVAEGVALLVEQTPWIRVVATAGSGAEAITAAERIRPDVVLLDLCLTDMLGSEVTAGIAERAPGAAVVIFTAYPDHAALAAAREAGAAGVVVKDARRADLVEVITRAARKEALSWSATAERMATGSDLDRTGLTRREYDVVRHVALGETNREIAESMYLSPNTVKTYLQSAFGKLGARNRVEAIAYAHQQGLL